MHTHTVSVCVCVCVFVTVFVCERATFLSYEATQIFSKDPMSYITDLKLNASRSCLSSLGLKAAAFRAMAKPLADPLVGGSAGLGAEFQGFPLEVRREGDAWGRGQGSGI